MMFVVRSTALDYHAPARLDDELDVSVVVERLGAASVQFFQEAWRETPDGRQLLVQRPDQGCLRRHQDPASGSDPGPRPRPDQDQRRMNPARQRMPYVRFVRCKRHCRIEEPVLTNQLNP